MSVILGKKSVHYDQVLSHHYHQDNEDKMQILLLVFLLRCNSEGQIQML